jgi:glycosyltransferase involved in cell wall biosynthesis
MGANGEYGGPVKVARELSSIANSVKGLNSRIIGGTNISTNIDSPNEKFIMVRKWIRTTSVSGFFSVKFAITFFKEFKTSDVLHLHFARDLIQIFAGLICLILKKPFITQTHGMIRAKNSRTKIFDNIFIKPILRNAKFCLVLSEFELNDLQKVVNGLNFVVVPNGIDASRISKYPSNGSQRLTTIAFCSRLHHTKGLDKFLKLAINFRESEYICFQIYGPDGGELFNILKQIELENQHRLQPIKYMGAIPPDLVGAMLQNIDLLVLPSKYDPYPMIVLESLVHGTPVLISNVCGNSSEVSSIDRLMVSMDNTDEDFSNRAGFLIEKYRDSSARVNLQTSAAIKFDISYVGETLIGIYKDASIGLNNQHHEK